MSTSSLHKLPPGSTLGSVPVDIRFYAAENPDASNRAGVVRSGGGILNNQPLFPAISGHLRPSPAISGHLRPSPGPPSERGRSRKAHNRQRRCSSPAEPFQPTETRRRRKNVYILYFLPCTPQSLAALKDCRPVRLAVSFSGFLGIIARSCRQPPHGRVQGAFSARPLWGSAETRQSPPEARKSAFPAMLGFPATGKVVVRSLRKVPGFYSLKIARRSAPFLFLSSSCSYRKKYHLNKGVSGYR